MRWLFIYLFFLVEYAQVKDQRLLILAKIFYLNAIPGKKPKTGFNQTWSKDTTWHQNALISFLLNLPNVKGQRSMNFGDKYDFDKVYVKM